MLVDMVHETLLTPLLTSDVAAHGLDRRSFLSKSTTRGQSAHNVALLRITQKHAIRAGPIRKPNWTPGPYGVFGDRRALQMRGMDGACI